MYEYIPQKSNQKATHAVGISLIGGTAVLGVTYFLPTLPFRWVVQLFGIVLLALGILLYTRYFTKAYVYRVTAREDGGLDFLVDEYRRKSRVTVCRIGLGGITEAVVLRASEPEKRDALKKRIRAEGRRAFDYSVDLLPYETCCLLCEEGGELFAITVQPDERLLQILQGESQT